jgi:hypothetical protein
MQEGKKGAVGGVDGGSSKEAKEAITWTSQNFAFQMEILLFDLMLQSGYEWLSSWVHTHRPETINKAAIFKRSIRRQHELHPRPRLTALILYVSKKKWIIHPSMLIGCMLMSVHNWLRDTNDNIVIVRSWHIHLQLACLHVCWGSSGCLGWKLRIQPCKSAKVTWDSSILLPSPKRKTKVECYQLALAQ